MDKIKSKLKLQLNNIATVENDPTIKKCTFSIIDFDVSENNQVISKELALKYAYTLKSKPLLCQYFNTTDFENQDDHFGDHGEYIGTDRYGNDTLKTNTIAIGTGENDAYVKTVLDENGMEKEALCCDYVLWYSRYPDIIDLMEEMVNERINLYSSCEYWFTNYTVKDGIQNINEPLYFDGHCMLQSGENGTDSIDPAYKISKLQSFNTALGKIINKEDGQGGDNMPGKKKEEKSVNEEVVTVEEPVMVDENVKTETTVEEVNPIVDEEKENMKKDIISKDETIDKLTAEVEALKSENEKVSAKYTEATEKIVSLNSTVEEMKPIVDEYNTEKIEKSINEAKEKYEAKFNKVGASDKFNTEEVQDLIKKSINSQEAVYQLNNIIVDMVDKVESSSLPIMEMGKSNNNLIGTDSNYLEACGIKID